MIAVSSRDVPGGDVPTVPEAPTRPDRGNARVSKPPERPSATSERYQLEAEIARGGMGRVVEAFDRELDRRVAIKEALTADTDTLLRFKREIWITARLEHPAIVPLYDAGTRSDGTPFYVMRKIGGRPLVELVEMASSVEARLALVPHVLAAARAIAHAHQRRVVHRDLKPSNILVGELGETVVIDWGLAKLYGEIDEGGDDKHSPVASAVETRVGTVMGTPGFMPPEQVAGGEADPRVDVYALGATMYYVLARQLPHAHSSTEALLHAVRHPATPISDLVPEVPRDLEAIIEVAISPDPATRFPDAGAMVAELERFLAGRLIASRRYTPFERLLRFVGRHRVAALAVVIAALALAIGGAFAFDRVLSARARAEDALDEAVHEREVAQDLLTTMTLARAQSMMETNPTAAVALVRSLATGARWREVRALVAEAEQHGVPRSLAGVAVPRRIAIAPVASRAALSDASGQVWAYDLETQRRTSLGIYRDAIFVFVDDRRLALAESGQVTVIDVVSGARTRFTTGGYPIAAAGHLLVQQATGEVYELLLATESVRLIGKFVARVESLGLSADAAWLTVATPTGIAVIERASGRVAHTFEADLHHVQWDPERGDRFAFTTREQVALISIGQGAPRRQVFPVDGFATIAFSRERICVSDMRGLRLLDEESTTSVEVTSGLAHLTTGAHGSCYAISGTRVRVLGGLTPRELSSPISVTRVVGAPKNPFVIGAGEGRLLIWRVTPPPRLIARTQPSALVSSGPHRVILDRGGLHWADVDLVTGEVRELRAPPSARPTSARGDPEGTIAVLIEGADAASRIFVVGFDTTRGVVAEIDDLFVAAGRVVAAQSDGTVLTATPELVVPVIRRPSRVSALDATPTSLAVAWHDGTLWMHGRNSLRTRTYDTPVLNVTLLPNGEVLLGSKDKLEIWRLDGRIDLLRSMAVPIGSVLTADDQRVLVYLTDGMLAWIDLRTGVERRTIVGSRMSFSTEGLLALSDEPTSRANHLHQTKVVDLEDGSSFRLALPSLVFSPALSVDGHWVAFVYGQALYALPLDLPASAPALAIHIDALTNAIIDPRIPSATVGWRD